MISESTGKTSDRFPCKRTERKDRGVLPESWACARGDPVGLGAVNAAVGKDPNCGKHIDPWELPCIAVSVYKGTPTLGKDVSLKQKIHTYHTMQ